MAPFFDPHTKLEKSKSCNYSETARPLFHVCASSKPSSGWANTTKSQTRKTNKTENENRPALFCDERCTLCAVCTHISSQRSLPSVQNSVKISVVFRIAGCDAERSLSFWWAPSPNAPDHSADAISQWLPDRNDRRPTGNQQPSSEYHFSHSPFGFVQFINAFLIISFM